MDIRCSQSRSWRPGPRGLWSLLGLAMAAIVMAIAVGGAVAAVPTFPDNLVVFPNRDFISAEGFSEHAGETALVTVTRPGTGVVGSTEVVVGPGDVPFEVNHPGGFCWGNNTALQVTPDILPGDVVSVAFSGGGSADVTTQDAFVTGVNYVDGATTFTVVGHIGAGVDPANTEQRIVNPDLTDTAVGRRDIRAVPGPLVPDRNNTYESSLEFAGDTFTATYVFSDAAVARIAATGGGERLLSWQNTDVDGNRQGITIAEFGELGGPGMGGCPNGPLVSGPVGPANVTAANVAGDIRVDWTPAVAIPGTPAITGYRVTAVAQTVSGGEQVEIGRRITGQAASSTRITGLASGETYDVYVVSVSSSGETFPAIHAIPVTDVTPPTVSATPDGGTFAGAQSVTLTADEPNAQIYYTLDDPALLDASGLLSAGALTYTGPINIATTTTLRAVAFDPSGNVSPIIEKAYTIDAGAIVAADAGPDQEVSVGAVVTLDGGNSTGPVTSYLWEQTSGPTVALTGADTATPTFTAPAAPATLTFRLTVDGFGGPSTDSVTVGVVNPAAPIADAGPDQTVTRGLSATTVTLNGAGSTPGATYLWEQIGSPGPADTATLTGANTLSPSFTLPLFAFPATNAARTFRLTVTNAAGLTATDTMTVTPVPGDSITVTKARFKNGDFRVDGTGTVDNAVVTIHSGSLGGTALGTATVNAGVWTLRLRNGAAPASNPGPIWVESTLGSTVGPIALN